MADVLRRLLPVLTVALALALPAAARAQSTGTGTAAGANDFGCVPSAEHPRPLVLTHGLGARAAENWSYLSPVFKAAGFCVFTLTYGVDARTTMWPYAPGGVIPMDRSAKELDAFVDRVLDATKAKKVDLVGHSEGTVMPRWYLEKLGGAEKVLRFVALTPLWRGTDVALLGTLRPFAPPGAYAPAEAAVGSFCGSCPQFIPGSDFLKALNADGEAVEGIIHTNILTRYDELVMPYTSGIMQDGGSNIILQDVCAANTSEHLAVAYDPAVAQLMLNALDPANKKPVPCDQPLDPGR